MNEQGNAGGSEPFIGKKSIDLLSDQGHMTVANQ